MNNEVFFDDTLLIQIVEKVFSIDSIKKRTRKQDYVSARQVFSTILRERGYTYIHIGKILGVGHANVIHYIRSAEHDLKIKSIQEKYLTCKEILENDSKIKWYTEDVENIVDHINAIEKENQDLREKIEQENAKYSRFDDIFATIRARVYPGKEEEFLSKINRILNGL
jgi:predicted transcriptional regulator